MPTFTTSKNNKSWLSKCFAKKWMGWLINNINLTNQCKGSLYKVSCPKKKTNTIHEISKKV